MAARRRSAAAARWQKRFGAYKEDLLKAGLLSIPLAIVARLNEALSSRVLGQPWQAVWLLVPLALVVVLLRRRAAREQVLGLDRRVLAFLGAYILLFTIAAQTSVLDISRELSVFGTPASRRWITPVSWGDWRYRLVPRVAEGDRSVVVLLRSGAGRSLLDVRKEVLDLVTIARQREASGLALDVYFTESTLLDPLLCQAITTAAAQMPVFVGYGFDVREGTVVERGVPATLQPCLPRERLAHLAGVLDHDLVSRLTPLYFRGDATRPALGLAVARAIAASRTPAAPLVLPGDGLVRFVAPAEGQPRVVSLEAIQSGSEDANLLRGRFVLAGERERDSFDTPFGRQPGVVIHGWVAHSLLERHFIERHSWWLGSAIILVCCGALTVRAAHGASVRELVLGCVAATAFVLALAVVSLFAGPYWFDVIYPLAAVWVLLPLLVGVRRLAGAGIVTGLSQGLSL